MGFVVATSKCTILLPLRFPLLEWHLIYSKLCFNSPRLLKNSQVKVIEFFLLLFFVSRFTAQQ
ncbi:CLUMA_CG000902, isoform A [Clunio marinus]|uniref:CLUMA_CG000902, isoform A n=1 Tax=Clunio marinus TaxID=568069 RepID=A0A1J1HGC7_9DIPT|nr:CLUMA_CG000902, isoform A [Clunio marinus]